MIRCSDIQSLQYVARNMCAIDCAEIFATRYQRDPDAIAAEALLAPHSYVCLREGIPVSAFGVVPAWPQVWNVWMFSTDAFTQRCGTSIVRHFKRVIAPDLLAQGCHRVQCDSLETHTKAHEFMRRFGAVAESRLHAYGSGGEDFFRFYWNRAALLAQVPKLRLARNSGKTVACNGDQRDIRVVTGN